MLLFFQLSLEALQWHLLTCLQASPSRASQKWPYRARVCSEAVASLVLLFWKQQASFTSSLSNHNRPSLGNQCWQSWPFLVSQTSFLKHPNGVRELFLTDFSQGNVSPAVFSPPCLPSHRMLWSPALSLFRSHDISCLPHLCLGITNTRAQTGDQPWLLNLKLGIRIMYKHLIYSWNIWFL